MDEVEGTELKVVGPGSGTLSSPYGEQMHLDRRNPGY